MLIAVAAMLFLILIAAGVTVADAVRSPHWRVVADERRHAWHERSGHERSGQERSGQERSGADALR